MDAAQELLELNRRLDRKVQQLEALLDFGRALSGAIDPDEVVRRLSLTLSGQWAVRCHATVAFREGRAPLVRQRGMPGVVGSPQDIASWSAPFRPTEAAAGSPLVVALVAARARAVVPLLSGETCVGFAALGERPGGLAYDDDDLAHAAGIAAQAVVALEAAWQTQEATHWKLLSEAGAEWRELDRVSRLVFVAVARLGFEKDGTERDLLAALGASLSESKVQLDEKRLTTALERLVEKGALSRDEGVLRIQKEAWLNLPETRKPLAELARQAGERIGAFEVLERIGGGGMGEVFRAVNVHDGSFAAVKLLHPHEMANEELRLRFEREGAIVASLAHPNIVRLLERGEHAGRLYLAMELLDGEALSARLKNALMPRDEALLAATQIASALAALHARGVVHRDLKSGNIMRTTSGRFVLLDFGLARGESSATLTTAGVVMGTLPYMPPEQIRGAPPEPSADVWSLGIVLFEMLFGRRPWRNTDPVTLTVEILSAAPLDPALLWREVGEETARLLADMLQPAPGARPRTGAEVLARLGGRLPADPSFLPADPSFVPTTSSGAVDAEEETIALQKPARE